MNDLNILDMNELLSIDDLPGIDGEEVVVYQPLELKTIESNPKERTIDLENDYTVVRKNLHFQQQMLMDAAKIFLESAKNADSPRHMEVFATLMGQMTTTNKELLKLHNEMKNITDERIGTKNPNGEQPQQGNVNIQNAQVFLGSPTDLMDNIGDAFETQQRIVSEQ